MRKILKSTLVFTLMLSILVLSNPANSKAASSKATAAYQSLIKQLKTKQPNTSIYTAIMRSAGGEDILLVSNRVFEGGQSSSAKIYQYVNGKVSYIGDVKATNPKIRPDEPLRSCGNNLSFTPGTDMLEDVIISNGKATDYLSSGLGSHSENITIKQYTMVNNKKTLVSTKVVLRKKIQYKDHYWLTGKSAKWVIIKFKKA